MRWDDEPYVRFYTRDTPTWKLWSWQTRTLFAMLIRKVDKAGLLDLDSSDDPLEALAATVELPLELVESALPALLRPGRNGKPATIELRGSVLVIPNYIEAQTATKTDALRKREERMRSRGRARAADIGVALLDETTPVTSRDSQSHPVTEESHPVTEPSRDVTERPSVLICSDLSCSDQKQMPGVRAEVQTLVDPDPPPLDYAAVYALYPRKEGKTAGMTRLRREIKTPAALAEFRLAVENYVRLTRDWPSDRRKYFSSFVSCWREFLDPEILASAHAAASDRAQDLSRNGLHAAKRDIRPQPPSLDEVIARSRST